MDLRNNGNSEYETQNRKGNKPTKKHEYSLKKQLSKDFGKAENRIINLENQLKDVEPRGDSWFRQGYSEESK